jgi:hypothetical protein
LSGTVVDGNLTLKLFGQDPPGDFEGTVSGAIITGTMYINGIRTLPYSGTLRRSQTNTFGKTGAVFAAERSRNHDGTPKGLAR